MKNSQTHSISSLSAIAAKLSVAGAAAFLVLLTALHFIKPELSPSWHMISEYAIGDHGWIMQAAFLLIAFSCIGMAFAIRNQAPTKSGHIGWILLCFAAIGMTLASFNVTDPIGTPASEMSSHGNMHGFGFMIGVPSLIIGVTLLTVSLRKSTAWASARKGTGFLVAAAWASLAIMGMAFAVLLPMNDGKFGPDVIIGWPNRLFMVACAAWLILVARHIMQLRKQRD